MEKVNTKLLDSYIWRAITAEAIIPVGKEPAACPSDYRERYLLNHFSELKNLWKGFSQKIKKIHGETFIQLTAQYVMYYYELKGIDRAKQYLVDTLKN